MPKTLVLTNVLTICGGKKAAEVLNVCLLKKYQVLELWYAFCLLASDKHMALCLDPVHDYMCDCVCRKWAMHYMYNSLIPLFTRSYVK